MQDVPKNLPCMWYGGTGLFFSFPHLPFCFNPKYLPVIFLFCHAFSLLLLRQHIADGGHQERV